MIRKQFIFDYTAWNKDELRSSDLQLLDAAQDATQNAYAPYSCFQVGAALLLEDGQIITGSNQENASFPAGICAERTALGAYSSLANNKRIDAIAVSYQNKGKDESFVISPCGICRQVIAEYEMRQNTPIRILLSGPQPHTAVWIIESANSLLPFTFTKNQLGL